MASKCDDCPRLKEYIEIGPCPECGTEKLLMSTRMCSAECDVCKTLYGIPMIVTGPCSKDARHKNCSILIHGTLNKRQLLDFSKLIGIKGVQAYRLFKSNTPVVLEDVPLDMMYRIRKFLQSAGASFEISSIRDDYPRYEECWGI